MLPDAESTEAVGRALAPTLAGGMIVTLSGDLGAGKTTLVRGVLRALDIRGPVKSPTYTLVEPYAVSSLYLYHFDFIDSGVRKNGMQPDFANTFATTRLR